jgi:hypothetical protein
MNNENIIQSYFGVLIKSRTYLNFLYLLLAFPLGLTYFIVLVTGLALGLSLIIIWVGLLILAVLFPLIWFLIAFERAQSIYLLGESIYPMSKPSTEDKGLLMRMKEFLTNPVTWKGLLFLFLKFPLGTGAFVLITVGLSVGLSLIFAPIIYPFATINLGFWTIDSFSEAIGLSIVGVLILPGIFHTFNFAARLFGKLSKLMLGQKDYMLQPNIKVQPEINGIDSTEAV